MRDIPDKADDDDYIPAEFNSFKDESRNVVITSDQTLSEANSFQVSEGISNYAGVGSFYLQTGSTNAYVLSAISPFKAPSQIFDGLVIRTRIVDSNTGASTLNWNGTGAKAIKKNRGTDDLASGDLVTDDYPIFIYEQSGNIWELVTEPIESNYPSGYLRGFRCEQDSGDPGNDIKMLEGAARGENDIADIKIAKGSSIIKQIDANWAEGTNQGGFPSGLTLTADTWYHFFEIAKATSFTDAGYDSAIDASNLLADATDYVDYKYSHSVFYETGTPDAIRDFVMIILPGGQRIIRWLESVENLTVTGSFPAIGIPQTLALTVPPNINVYAHFGVDLSEGSSDATALANFRFWSPLMTNLGYSNVTGPADTQPRIKGSGHELDKLTNESQQIKWQVDAKNTDLMELTVFTIGWML